MALAGSAVAGEKGECPGHGKKGAPAKRGAKAGQKDGHRKGRKGKHRPGKQLNRLRQAMDDRLELSAEQVEAIDALFLEFTTQMDSKSGAKTDGQADERRARRQELHDQMVAAKESGDSEALAAAKEAMGAFRRERGEQHRATMQGFFDQVSAELNEEQAEKFQTMARRFAAQSHKKGRGGKLRQLVRAVRSPEVGLSDEQGQQIRDIVSAMRAPAADGEKPAKDPEAKRAARAEARQAILDVLTEEQREQVEQLLAADKRGRHKPGDRHRGDRHGKGSRRGPQD